MHRPYHRMPETSLAVSYLFALANDGADGRARLEQHCKDAGIDCDALLEEMASQPDVVDLLRRGNHEADAYPLTIELSRKFRKSAEFQNFVAEKMSLGTEVMKDIGNVYCASLPAWIAAGMEEAAETGRDLTDQSILAVGYGSGDAAEAIPMRAVRGWQDAASRIGFRKALVDYQDLSREQYESLHYTGDAGGLHGPSEGFVIETVGTSSTAGFSDEGIEYYRVVQ
jgi:hydroxymethylglutaryl-CoA synthase